MSPADQPGGRRPGRVLVLGGGGREHALAWSLAREAGVEAVLVAPGSDAIGDEPKVRCVPGVSAAGPGRGRGAGHAPRTWTWSWSGRRRRSPPASRTSWRTAGVPDLRADSRPRRGSSGARRSAARSRRRPACGWPAARAFAALEPALAFARQLAERRGRAASSSRPTAWRPARA